MAGFICIVSLHLARARPAGSSLTALSGIQTVQAAAELVDIITGRFGEALVGFTDATSTAVGPLDTFLGAV